MGGLVVDNSVFLLLAEATGADPEWLAGELMVDVEEVYRWFVPGNAVPEAAGCLLEGLWEDFLDRANETVERVRAAADEYGSQPQAVRLSMYQSDESLRASGSDIPNVRMHLAAVRTVYTALKLAGIEAETVWVPVERGVE